MSSAISASSQEETPPWHPHTLHGLPCPFDDCDYQSNDPTMLHSHLHSSHHGHSLRGIHVSSIHPLHLCRECDSTDYVYTSRQALQAHRASHHRPPTRVRTNLDYICDSYPSFTARPNWQESLLWLDAHIPEPSPFPSSCYFDLRPRTRKQVNQAYAHILRWVAATNNINLVGRTHPSRQDSTSTPFWKLLIIFPSLILYPAPKKTREQDINSRLQLFRQGQLQTLYDTMHNAATSRPPKHPNKLDSQVQRYCDLEFFGKAFRHLHNEQSLAPMTPERAEACQQLYPPPVNYKSPGGPIPPLPPPQDRPILKVTTTAVMNAALSIAKGTGCGPFTDPADLLREVALHHDGTDDKNAATHPFLTDLTTVINAILHNNVPKPILPFISSNRFVALFKDPTDESKLRPIGIGTCLRRLAGKVVLQTLGDDFAELFVQAGQYGISVKSGIDLAVHLLQLQMEKYMTEPQAKGLDPTRVLLVLDLINMFNNVSRRAVWDWLIRHPQFHCLIPYYNLSYAQSNRCYYLAADGTIQFFLQKAGHAQGDPLGPLFSCLVLLPMLQQLNAEQANRAACRVATGDRGDDDKGGLAHSVSIMDDTSIWLPHEDLHWYITQLHQRGPNYGLFLSIPKTSILTTTGSEPILSTRHSLSDRAVTALADTLRLLSTSARKSPPEATSGTTLLGVPIGSNTFCQQFLHDKLNHHCCRIQRLQQYVHDRQTAAILFRLCEVPTILHLLSSALQSQPTLPRTPSSHATYLHFARQAFALHQSFLMWLSSTSDMEDISTAIAYAPESHGGLGFRDVQAIAPARYAISMARTIDAITNGARTGSAAPHRIRLPLAFQTLGPDWTNTTLGVYKRWRTFLPLTTIPSDTDPETTTSRLTTPLLTPGCSKTIYNKIAITRIRTVTQAPETAHLFPSILSQISTLALHTTSRAVAANRLPNNIYRTALCNKLHLPIYDLPPNSYCQWQGGQLRCHRRTDRYGDHVLRCRGAYKSALHNRMVHAIGTILQAAAKHQPADGLYTAENRVVREPIGLLRPYIETDERPADVAIYCTRHGRTPTDPRIISIDVTITKATSRDYNFTPPHSSHPPKTPLSGAHWAATETKLRISHQHDKFFHAMESNQILLVPATIDRFGGLGPPIQKLLFGDHNPELPDIDITRDWSNSITSQRYKTLERQLLTRHSLCNPSPRFKRWAIRTLSLNFTRAIGEHLLRYAPQEPMPLQSPHKYTFKGYLPTPNHSEQGDPIFLPGEPPTTTEAKVGVADRTDID